MTFVRSFVCCRRGPFIPFTHTTPPPDDRHERAEGLAVLSTPIAAATCTATCTATAGQAAICPTPAVSSTVAYQHLDDFGNGPSPNQLVVR